MNPFIRRHTTFEFIGEEFESLDEFESPNSPQFDVVFHFIFKSQHKHYLLNQPQPFRQSLPSFTGITAVAVSAAARDSPPPLERVAEAVDTAAAGRLPGDERRALFELVRNQIRTSFSRVGTLPGHGALHLFFDVSVEHQHVYVRADVDENEDEDEDEDEDKAEFGILEEYEVGRARADVDVDEDEEERCCSICLEEIIGGGSGGRAARTPCKHVFHGGCIKKWLRKSHYCPLCRYEMHME